MEKQIKLKSKMLKAVTAVTLTFQNHPFSPGRDHHHHHNHKYRSHNKGFSGPIIRKHPNDIGVNNNNNNKDTRIIDYQEPSSPKISCMGQIKHKKSKERVRKSKTPSSSRDIEVKKHVSTTFQRMLTFHVGKTKSAESRKSDASAPPPPQYNTSAPRVSDMKRFASGRDTFANFDWKQQEEEEVEEDDDVIIPFSAPILVGGGDGVVLDLKPRKEINLWKRRTMTPPRPLQLDLIV